MQHSVYQPAFHRRTPSVKPGFKLFIACEDQAAFMQARKVQSQVEALCGREIKISRMLWNFSLLRHDQLRGYAVTEAADADMIVISFRAGSDLPPHVRYWMESLPTRPQAGQAALVILISHPEENWAERHSHIDYVRQIAEGRGLDFFCNQIGRQALDLPKPTRRRPAEHENIIAHQGPWSTGGIND